jgi:hypothetical protein
MIRAWTAAAALSIALVACGGDSKGEPTPTPSAGGTSTARADTATPPAEDTRTPTGIRVSAQEALGPAAKRASEAQSLRATFVAIASLGTQDRTFSGRLSYRAPNATHVDSSYFGRAVELLLYDPNYYVNTPDGWKSVDVPTFAPTLGQLFSVAEKRGFFDLERLVPSLGEVQQLPDGDINGVLYTRYSAAVELSQIADQLPGGIADPAALAEAEQYIQSLQFDFWITKDSQLPRRVMFVVDMSATPDGAAGIEMTVDYPEYNGAVEIPAEPVAAPPLEISDLR